MSLFLMIYMILAMSWWSVLLFTKNQDARNAKLELLSIRLVAEGHASDERSIRQHPEYVQIYEEYQKQEWMILGEGLFFVLSMIAALYFINRSYRRAVELAEEKRNFILSITHELKTPLASLRLAGETLQHPSLSVEQRKLLAVNSLRDTDRLQVLVDNLLLAARMEGQYELQPTDIDLVPLIHKVCSFHQDRSDMHIQLTAPAHAVIYADELLVNSLLHNLLDNAIKYSPGADTVDLILRTEAGRYELCINDQGIGIPGHERRAILKRFYRIGSEDTRTTQGSGMGLYIVDQIVQRHGWSLSIADNEPRGTRFCIIIPERST